MYLFKKKKSSVDGDYVSDTERRRRGEIPRDSRPRQRGIKGEDE